jgi:hypothetical protein
MVIRPIPLLAALWLTALPAQELMEGIGTGGRLMPADEGILELGESRTDLPCRIRPVNPELQFDFSFHPSYDLEIPLRELAETKSITAVFRVIPEGRPEEAVHFRQKWTVPELPDKPAGSVHLRGEFVVGEGEYRVDWLMRDDSERYCSASWRVSARLKSRDRQVALHLAPRAILPFTTDLFQPEAPVPRDLNQPLKIRILLHLSAPSKSAAAMRTAETMALLSMLRNIAREPRIGSVSITAFNIDQGRILYRQQAASQIDFPGLGQAIQQSSFGTISVQTLREPVDAARFMSDLLIQECAGDEIDALIFIGPARSPEAGAWRNLPKALSTITYPVFYLNYNPMALSNPWRDSIGSVVKFLRGVEYVIAEPRDVSLAWNEIMSRIEKDSTSQPAFPRQKDRSAQSPTTSLQRQKGS